MTSTAKPNKAKNSNLGSSEGYSEVNKNMFSRKMGTKTQMYKFCVKQLELYVHPAKSYSKSEYYFKIIQGLKKCVSLQQVLMIDEDPVPGTEAVALR
jgi:hypothetical protein